MANYLEQLKKKANGHHQKVVAFAILGALIGGLSMFLIMPHEGQAPTPHDLEVVTPDIEKIEAADPIRLRIPSADIDTTFEGALELNKDQTVMVPESYEEVGWYKFGPKPGELGPAVILGHVDSFEGPAVFYSLGQTKVGDVVYIDREDGTTALFEVIEVGRYPQSNFPTEKVYSDLDYAGLRVITCTGVYDHGTLRYSHNLIVYAKLVDEIETGSEIISE